jgi:plasmid stabilization system protein ParE
VIVHLLPDAETDLEAIADVIAQDNPRRALSFVLELRDKCLGLGDAPSAFPLIPRYEQQGIRHRVHGSYQIFYRVLEKAKRIEVIHILHGARDCTAILFP